MKKFIILLSLVAAAAHANRESGGRRVEAHAVWVNFTSPGNGIDYSTYEMATGLLDAAQTAGKLRERTTERWGREGEVLVCAHFESGAKGVSPSRQFIKQIAPSILADTERMRGLERTAVLIGPSCEDIAQASVQDIREYVD